MKEELEKLFNKIVKEYQQEAVFATRYSVQCGAITEKDAAHDKGRTESKVLYWRSELDGIIERHKS